MYKVGRKQERFNEGALSIEKVKSEMPSAIDEENKRINVDSSKKRACLQHMDYDGFHQMVLGANLVPIKSGSLSEISNDRTRWHGLNTHAALSEIMTKNYEDKQELLEKYADMYRLEEDLKRVPRSQNEFDKYFVSKLKTTEERFKYILNIPISEVSNIFKSDVNSELLVQVLNVFIDVIKDRLQMKDETNEEPQDEKPTSETQNADLALFSYIGDFMNLVGQSGGFDF